MSLHNGNGNANGKPRKPSENGDDGRAENGQFAKGWRGGPGRPLADKIAKLQAALVKAATPGDIEKIGRKLIAMALEGDVAAAKEMFDRLFGRSKQAVDLNVKGKVEYATEVHDDMRRVLDSPEAAHALRALNDRVRSN